MSLTVPKGNSNLNEIDKSEQKSPVDASADIDITNAGKIYKMAHNFFHFIYF